MTRFFVPGVPVPKGSAKAFWNPRARRIVVTQDNRERQRPWSSMISLSAQAAGLRPCGSGVLLRLEFLMPRPKSHVRKNGTPRPSAPRDHVVKPDLDKLVRCVLDALTGIAYEDDSQVAWIEAAKRYGSPVGCRIEIDREKEL